MSVLRSSQKERAFVGARAAVGTLKLKTGQNFLLLCSDRKLRPSTVEAWLVPLRSGLGGLSLNARVNVALGRGPLWGAGQGCGPSTSATCSVPLVYSSLLSVLISKMDMKE